MPITENDLTELLTVEEARQILGIGKTTMYKMVETRAIDVVRVGSGRGRLRIPRRAILDHLNRNLIRHA